MEYRAEVGYGDRKKVYRTGHVVYRNEYFITLEFEGKIGKYREAFYFCDIKLCE